MKTISRLVRNEENKGKFSRLICNLLPTGCRVDNLEGREYTVVPMVMLTEGVHSGSFGPIYYPPEELSKTPVVWNHKPVVVYHPTMNGEGISACDPIVLNSRKVGLIMNTKIDGGRLKAEAWIEKERADKVDERIMEAVRNSETMELSTGVFLDIEDKEGEWKGEKYVGIARNFRPDHLALLPDQTGACSVQDGAGFIRNQQKNKGILAGLKSFLAKLGIVDNLSFSDISMQLAEALNEKFNPHGKGNYIWVVDTFSNFVVYSVDGDLYRVSYTATETGVTIGDDTPAKVARVTEYRSVPAENKSQEKSLPGKQATNQDTHMNKKATIDAIIAANAGWAEADREALMALNDNQLTLVKNSLKKVDTTSAAPEPPPVKSDVKGQGTTQNASTEVTPVKKSVTVADYIAGAPREIQDVLNNGLSAYNEEKSKLVEVILANKLNSFSKQDLETRPLGELKALARLAGAPTPAEAAARFDGQGISQNSSTPSEEPVLELPAMNFASK